MRKEHSVFITISGLEMADILNKEFKRRGWLKDIPNYANLEPWDDTGDICLEYRWEENS